MKKAMKLVKKLFNYKIYAWIIVLLLIVGTVFYMRGYLSAVGPQKVENQSYSTVKYIEKVNQTVFLSVGIQHVETKTENTKIPWTDIGIPLSEKKALIILNYQAKMGIKKPVRIIELYNNNYQIEVPEYEVIGISLDEEKPYQLYDSRGELLSASTKDIDTGEMVTKSLSNKDQEMYLKNYREQITESAKNYYMTLFKSINPDANVTFIFSD